MNITYLGYVAQRDTIMGCYSRGSLSYEAMKSALDKLEEAYQADTRHLKGISHDQ